MTEDKPHVVYAGNWGDGAPAFVFSNYAGAYEMWRRIHTHQVPYLIATLGRVIDPSAPVIDPNE